MKKILVGFLVATSFFLTLQVISVQGELLFDNSKIKGIIHNIQDILSEKEAAISNLLWDKRDERLTQIEAEISSVFQKVSLDTNDDLERYKEMYLKKLIDTKENASLQEQYRQLSKEKASQIETEIEGEITDYLRQLLGQEENQQKIVE